MRRRHCRPEQSKEAAKELFSGIAAVSFAIVFAAIWASAVFRPQFQPENVCGGQNGAPTQQVKLPGK